MLEGKITRRRPRTGSCLMPRYGLKESQVLETEKMDQLVQHHHFTAENTRKIEKEISRVREPNVCERSRGYGIDGVSVLQH